MKGLQQTKESFYPTGKDNTLGAIYSFIYKSAKKGVYYKSAKEAIKHFTKISPVKSKKLLQTLSDKKIIKINKKVKRYSSLSTFID